jgi:hypothetical protein
MAQTILWQHDCPGHIETEVIDGVIHVICYVQEDMPPPEPPSRVTEGLQVLYAFNAGSGTTIHDRSNVGPPVDLLLETEAAVSWLSGGGLSVRSPTIISSRDPATKLIDAVQASNEVAIEAWVKPANIIQDGPARIVSLSTDFHNRNFQVAQAAELYDVRLRTTETTENGRPSLSTPFGSVATELTHVVYTRAASGMARIFIDGNSVVGRIVPGTFSNWDRGYRFALADELIGNRTWLGEYHLIAVYSRALSADEIGQNFRVGPRALA